MGRLLFVLVFLLSGCSTKVNYAAVFTPSPGSSFDGQYVEYYFKDSDALKDFLSSAQQYTYNQSSYGPSPILRDYSRMKYSGSIKQVNINDRSQLPDLSNSVVIYACEDQEYKGSSMSDSDKNCQWFS